MSAGDADGYTLAEALAALIIIGLAMGGLTQGVRLIGRGQDTVTNEISESRAMAATQSALQHLFESRGPFRSTEAASLIGDSQQLSFPCDTVMPCQARLQTRRSRPVLEITDSEGHRAIRLPAGADIHFVYGASEGAWEAWPPRGPSKTLATVSIVATAGQEFRPLAGVHLWADQPGSCEFDPILTDCRSAGS